ncbi:hypothetical protein [Amycolatopsis sp. cmx-11-32]|uniref:restriction system modified-DNA reader domain-containing protein n=1 Tax=Amycolatopsis sp. cmx-11-32 TaxID=2785796 RepID=UPI0039E5B7C1
MTTESDTMEAPTVAVDVAAAEEPPAIRTDRDDGTADAGETDGEAILRDWEGLPPDATILVPAFTAPMRMPVQAWAMLVLAVDILDVETEGPAEVELFAGCWMPDMPSADLHDGDLVVRLAPPADPICMLPRDRVADVEMLLAYHGRWQHVGLWKAVDDRWPRVVAPTAAALMGLHVDATEAAVPPEPAPSLFVPPVKGARGGVAELLAAGMIKAGEDFVWARRHIGVEHFARVRADGCLVLSDGRAYANPSGATTALGGNHQNGWSAFRRVSDGRTLGDLRRELAAQRGQ